MARIPVNEFTFPAPGPDMFYLQCKNHPEQEYLTKNPHQRGLHRTAPIFGDECPCPFADLIVLTEEDSKYND